jgi:hypothetical protein
MTCILINEENHGTIGVATDYKSAIKWLIKERWLDDNTDLYIDGEWITMTEWVPDWKNYLLVLEPDEIKELFDGLFYFKEIEFYNAAN